ncbi:helix-turn-helix DNA binding domain protein [Arthrobacter phage JayCookie]|uniref:Helix-turn-helix DNA binding domain protein n=7 Tax=Klausavirus princesstrina TaxID=1984784 RepID=A0A1J0GRM7_9CAUD|nr:DNA binding protein [Arthrobacter phage PrincessTrina]ANU79640.1 helix-turn-helix DNA binding domain protein [Arthrobacter phage Conboy]AOZ64590.1 helix-turn-helix DNA binding domain protein [Arthrobacter phage Chubster]APC44721.1 helix-turn-helix DNA binding domain protein [Arthrobacter phage EdgarPoe]ASX99045.1 helix-turn-helix DNA binding domain protein [Arthrobacter phage Scavito]ASZ73248.1 helix-turn-helix DNA binding domain protein [Arthrobacter phage JayCookie]QEQ94538.1 helix-turn-
MPKKPVRLIGYAEIAATLKVEVKTVRAWQMRDNMPTPDFITSHSPGWKPATIQPFIDHVQRHGKPGGFKRVA